MSKTFEEILKYMVELQTGEFVPGRASRYNVPDVLMKGASIIVGEAQQVAKGENGEETGEVEEADEPAVTADDLSAEDPAL